MVFPGLSDNWRPRHQFVITPLRENNPFPGRAELYHCISCKWNFAVSGWRVAALDAQGHLMEGRAAMQRLALFAEGPCPTFDFLLASQESLEQRLHRRTSVIRFGRTRRRVVTALLAWWRTVLHPKPLDITAHTRRHEPEQIRRRRENGGLVRLVVR